MHPVFRSIIQAVARSFVRQKPPLALEDSKKQIPFGLPHVDKDNTAIICRHAYVTENDKVAKLPIWVSYVLTPDHAEGDLERSNNFESDQSLPRTQRAYPRDYEHSGYDIGHIANAGDMRWSEQTENESFYLTNMCPQIPNFNRGIWKVLETQVRDWARERQHSLLIYAGPIYNVNIDSHIGIDHVCVPHEFYKIVVDLTTKEVKAYLFPHKEHEDSDLTPFESTAAEIESKTGVTFPLPKN